MTTTTVPSLSTRTRQRIEIWRHEIAACTNTSTRTNPSSAGVGSQSPPQKNRLLLPLPPSPSTFPSSSTSFLSFLSKLRVLKKLPPRHHHEEFDRTAMYDPIPQMLPSSSLAEDDAGPGSEMFVEGRGGAEERLGVVGKEEKGDWQGGDGESVVVAGDLSSGAESKSGATRGERGLMARKERLERAARLLGK
jgi:hypothetical protein